METRLRTIDCSVAFASGMQNFVNLPIDPESFSARKIVGHFERNMLCPMVGLCRSYAEAEVLEEKAYLELSPEEFAATKRTIEKDDKTGGTTAFTHKPLDREECQKVISEFSSFSDKAKIFEAVVQSGLLTTCAIGIEARCKKLAEVLQAREHYIHPGVPALLDHNVLAAIILPPESVSLPPRVQPAQDLLINSLDLLASPSIPEALQDDVVFSANICPISREPIRHPVGDPNNRTIYERDYLYRAIDQTGLSPITRRPLTREQLIPMPDLQNRIDSRLRMYQEAFRAYIAEHQNQQSQA